MEVGVLDIKIIDTHENDRVLQLEDTEAGAPKLQYNGSDDKYGSLMAGELRFNLNVTSLIDAKYGHLFTGSETRYKVLLEDVTNEANPVELWSGFLLPEQFSEPYDNGSYFVEFIATDGIGRLKNKEWFGSGRSSIVSVIQTCLNATGLEFPIMFAPAIQNSAFELNYTELEVDTSSYVKDGEGMSLYDVLQKVLESIGCVLFQFKSCWYVIGLNRRKEKKLDFYKYAYSPGVFEPFFEGKEEVVRNRFFYSFFATPLVQVLPVLNKINVAWDWDVNKNLLPEKIISAIPDNFEYDSFDTDMVYWNLSKNDDRLQGNTLFLFGDLEYDYSKIQFDSYYNGFVFKSGESKVLSEAVIVIRSGEIAGSSPVGGELSFVQLQDLENNFISLKAPVFIEGSDDIDRTATLFLEGSVELYGSESNGELEAARSAIDDDIANDILKNHIIAELFYKEHEVQLLSEEELYLSTRLDNDLPKDMFSFNFTRSNDRLNFKLEAKNLMFNTSGYYNLRLYPLVRHLHLKAQVFISKLEFIMDFPSTSDYKVDKGLDFTTTEDLEVFHSTTRMDISNRRLYFSEELKSQISSGSLDGSYISVSKRYYRVKDTYNGEFLWYTNIFIGVSDDVYRMLQGGFSLYKQLPGSATKVFVNPKDYVIGRGESGLEIRQIKFVGTSLEVIEENAELFVSLNTESSLFYLDSWLDKWQLVNGYSADNKKFHEVVGDMYLALRKRSSYFITGVLSGLAFPLDLLIFNFIERKDFIPTNLTLDLSNNQTEITMFEVLPEDSFVVGESDGGIVEVPEDAGDPLITISATSTYVKPMTASYYWQVSVDFEIKNIAPVNATLKLIKYSDAIYNNGVPTGLVKEFTITEASGNYKHIFSSLLDEEKGWYEVVLEQDGVQSNKEYVKISELITDNVITISQVSLQDRTIVIDVEHSLGFPNGLTKKWQEFGSGDSYIPIGLYPVGIEQSQSISPTTTQFTHTFSKDGIFKIHVTGDGIDSNVINVNTDSWFD